MTRVTAWLAGALAALALLVGAHAYRLSLIHDGYVAGVNEQRKLFTAAADEMRERYSAATAASETRHAVTLQSLKETHARKTNELRQALANSDLRAARLDADVRRLLDQAARAGEPAPAPADAPEGSPGTPAADHTVADLIETVNENYAICHRNAARLAELQAWYEALRAQGTSQ